MVDGVTASHQLLCYFCNDGCAWMVAPGWRSGVSMKHGPKSAVRTCVYDLNLRYPGCRAGADRVQDRVWGSSKRIVVHVCDEVVRSVAGISMSVGTLQSLLCLACAAVCLQGMDCCSVVLMYGGVAGAEEWCRWGVKSGWVVGQTGR